MSWDSVDADGDYEEWERDDGYATIRLRERADGGYTVRVDRLKQAADGAAYRHETVADRDAAVDLVEAWKAEFDTE
ncbi:DUF7543 family protein [Halobaculum sp. D14]|uniref:DUF7543 family protein n=1 Tax=unclassified Halobaculum TaxID=2640896 RepID=UPI003EBD87D2